MHLCLEGFTLNRIISIELTVLVDKEDDLDKIYEEIQEKLMEIESWSEIHISTD